MPNARGKIWAETKASKSNTGIRMVPALILPAAAHRNVNPKASLRRNGRRTLTLAVYHSTANKVDPEAFRLPVGF
ncbi:hypothetical protein WCLP8_2130002 [uncultured Gammaproteobacteria bacterium]